MKVLTITARMERSHVKRSINGSAPAGLLTLFLISTLLCVIRIIRPGFARITNQATIFIPAPRATRLWQLLLTCQF